MPGSCWSAATDAVTYTADPIAGDQVFVVPASGGTPRAVTRAPIVAFEPTFSPDGSWIVFERYRPNRSEIWKVRVDGTGLQRLTAGFDDRQPNWSPAGDRIVFQRHARNRPNSTTDLWTISPSGDAARNVTRTRELEETDASWSPSGRFLVFSSDATNVDVASLFTIRADGSGRRQLTRTRAIYDGAPAWSPDGRQIAFESVRGDPDSSRGTTIWVVAAPAGRR
jgi:TolB protein